MATIAPADSKIGQQITRIMNAKQKMANYLENNSSLAVNGLSINEIVDEVLALIDKKGDYNVVQNLLENGNTELAITDAGESSSNNLDAFITREISGVYTNSRITKIGNSAFNYCTEITAFNLPNVTWVGFMGFNGCTKLKEINLPLCQTIEGSSFDNCENLETISLPLCTTLGNNAFWGCSKLTQVNLPLVTVIESSTFRNTGVKQLDFLSVGNIKDYAFNYASQLDTLILRNSSVCTLEGSNAFKSTKIAAGTGYVYVPDNLVDSYKTATNWVTFANQIKPISELEETT